MQFLNFLLRLPRNQKRIIQVVLDALMVGFCYALAMFLRLDSWSFMQSLQTWYILVPVIPVTILFFIRMGLYRAVLRYIGNQAVSTVVIGVLFSAVTMFVVSQIFGWFVPRSVPAIYALLAIIILGGMRLVWRTLYVKATASTKARVIIYGAGASGRQVLASLRNGEEYAPVAFLDDDATLHGSLISGLRVFPSDALGDLLDTYAAKMVLLAMPRLSRKERQVVLEQLEPYDVQIQTIPGMADLVMGRALVGDIRAVTVEDLLGRTPVPPLPELLAENVTGKSVMVTGAGGSIGSELCRQILALEPKYLVLLEQSEFGLYQIDRELQLLCVKLGVKVKMVQLLGSVQNSARTEAALRRFNVQTVYHAAAYKHVPLVEYNIVEGVQNNVFGTLCAAEAAIAAGVEAFIMVSTDKAVRPTNVMGATKRMGELICQAHARAQTKTKFSMVRFGNVLGSSGSVIPLFRAQIERGGPVTVTHPEITRYFMTIPEAALLVIQAGAMAKGGDVFVLDMGDPIPIVDLAARMIRLSGLKPWIAKGACPGTALETSGDIEIRFTGLRPGEKLYEELLIEDTSNPTRHSRVMTASETHIELKELTQILDELRQASNAQDAARLRACLQSAPTGYAPQSQLTDLMSCPHDAAGAAPANTPRQAALH